MTKSKNLSLEKTVDELELFIQKSFEARNNPKSSFTDLYPASKNPYALPVSPSSTAATPNADGPITTPEQISGTGSKPAPTLKNLNLVTVNNGPQTNSPAAKLSKPGTPSARSLTDQVSSSISDSTNSFLKNMMSNLLTNNNETNTDKSPLGKDSAPAAGSASDKLAALKEKKKKELSIGSALSKNIHVVRQTASVQIEKLEKELLFQKDKEQRLGAAMDTVLNLLQRKLHEKKYELVERAIAELKYMRDVMLAQIPFEDRTSLFEKLIVDEERREKSAPPPVPQPTFVHEEKTDDPLGEPTPQAPTDL